VQKVHPYRLDAFSSGDAGPLGFVEENTVRLTRNWPLPVMGVKQVAINNIANAENWPRVEIVLNHAGASGGTVDALVLQAAAGYCDPVRGIVVAGTGNGTVHHVLEAALLRAQAAGITVVLATRCAQGRVLAVPGSMFPDSQGLSPVKARIALMLELL
jgi:L-asparaginase